MSTLSNDLKTTTHDTIKDEQFKLSVLLAMTVAIKTRDLKLAATSVVAAGIHPPLGTQKGGGGNRRHCPLTSNANQLNFLLYLLEKIKIVRASASFIGRINLPLKR